MGKKAIWSFPHKVLKSYLPPIVFILSHRIKVFVIKHFRLMSGFMLRRKIQWNHGRELCTIEQFLKVWLCQTHVKLSRCMPRFNTTFWVKCIPLIKTCNYTEHGESPNHTINLACHCPALPSTVSSARLLLVTFLKGELIAKPGQCFNWGDPWNQRTKSSKVIYWWILWINRSAIHAGILTGRGFLQRSSSLCVLSGCDSLMVNVVKKTDLTTDQFCTEIKLFILLFLNKLFIPVLHVLCIQ